MTARPTDTGSRAHTDDISLWRQRMPWLVAGAVLLFGYVPMAFLGPGTDLDTAGIYRAGRSILSGDYVASRRPGAPVYETIVGVLHALGGSVLVNLASVAMAAALAYAVVLLIRDGGGRRAEWLGVVVLVNPFVWIAGTSMADHVWAIGFAVLGALAQRRSRPVLAILCFALAIGCRLPIALIVAALLLADWLHATRERRRMAMIVAGGTLLLGALIFLPPALTLRGEMLEIGVTQSTWPVRVGRSVVKNFYFFGPILLVTVAVLVPALWRGVREHWRDSAALRMGLLVFVAAELLFLDFPWKLAHLIPAWIGLVLVLGSTRVVSRNVVVALLVGQVALGLVDVNLAQPDVAGQATGGRLSVSVEKGPLLRDAQCRADSDRDAYRRPDGSDAVLPTWSCVVPWGTDDTPAPPGS